MCYIYLQSYTVFLFFLTQKESQGLKKEFNEWGGKSPFFPSTVNSNYSSVGSSSAWTFFVSFFPSAASFAVFCLYSLEIKNAYIFKYLV